MNPITVSINPLYLCNFRCKFCYLTPEQLADRQSMSVFELEERLFEIRQHTTIKHIDFYGGEVGLLPPELFADYKKAIRKHYKGTINIVTNLSRVPSFFLEDDISLSVSYDFDCRERNEEVYRNIATTNKRIHILVLASKELLSRDVDYMIMMLNALRNVSTVEIKPYSSNQANQHNVTHEQYEQFVKRWITSKIPKRFALMNQHQIARSLNKQYNAFSDDHIYITPQGKFAVLSFDLNDNEFFEELDSIEQYQQWAKNEKELVTKNPHCSKCKYMGNCLTEHYRWVWNTDHSCNGYKHLLDWYDERVGNKTIDILED